MADIEKKITKIGNGAYLPLSQDILRSIGAQVGDKLRVVTQGRRLSATVVDNRFDETYSAADRMVQRYARTLELLGNER